MNLLTKVIISIIIIMGMSGAFGQVKSTEYIKTIEMSSYTVKVTKFGYFELFKDGERFYQGPFFVGSPVSPKNGAVTRIRQYVKNSVLAGKPEIKVTGDEQRQVVTCVMIFHPEAKSGVPEGMTLANLFPDQKLVKLTVSGEFLKTGKVTFNLQVEFLSEVKWEKNRIKIYNNFSGPVCRGYPYLISWQQGVRGVKKGVNKGVVGKKLEGLAREGRYLVGGRIKTMSIGTKFGFINLSNFTVNAGVRGPKLDSPINKELCVDCSIPTLNIVLGKSIPCSYQMQLFTKKIETSVPKIKKKTKNKAIAKARKNKRSISSKTAFPVKDRYRSSKIGANRLFLNSLPKQPWWNKKWNKRLPVLLSEPVGLERNNAPISVFCKFPLGAFPESTRVVTPYLEEIPSQIRIVNREQRLIEVIFLDNLWRYETRPVFIYFSDKKMPGADDDSDLRVKVNSGYEVRNEFLEVRYRKKPMLFGAVLDSIRPTGGRSDNQISHLGNMGSWNHLTGAQRISLFKESGCLRSELVEKGPIRTRVKYYGQDFTIEYSIYSKNDTVFYLVTSGGDNLGLKIGGTWNIAGDREDDAICYLTENGIVKVPLEEIVDQQRKFIGLKDNMEGWLALEDRKNEVIGFIFEPGQGSAGARPHFQGMLTRISLRMKANSQVSGGVVCNRGNYKCVRNSYIAWKNPVKIYLGTIQKQQDIKPVKPVCGKDFFLVHHLPKLQRQDEETAVNAVRHMVRRGANAIQAHIRADHSPYWQSKAFTGEPGKEKFLQELIDVGNKYGVIIKPEITAKAGVYSLKENVIGKKYDPKETEMWLTVDGKKRSHSTCPLRCSEYFTFQASELAGYDVGPVYTLDEFVCMTRCPICRQAFKDQYGVDAPVWRGSHYLYITDKDNVDVNGKYILFKMNMASDILIRMAKAAAKVNSEIVFSPEISGSQRLVSNYLDLEKMAPYFKSVTPATGGILNRKDWLKYIKGAFGNNKDVTAFGGYQLCSAGVVKSEDIVGHPRKKIYADMLWGATSYELYISDDEITCPKYGQAVAKEFNTIKYTGLGNSLLRLGQIKHIGILRDRKQFIEGIKTGEYRTQQGLTNCDFETKNLLKLTNLPIDIIFSSYFKLPLLKQYQLIIVPDNPLLDDKLAGILKKYIETGGRVIFEGGTINNALVRELCQVEKNGKRQRDRKILKGVAGAVRGVEWYYSGSFIPVKSLTGTTLVKSADDTILAVSRDCGKGKIIYINFSLVGKAYESAVGDQLLRGLIREISGPLPIETESEYIDTNVFGKNGDIIVGIHNLSIKPKDIVLKINLPVKPDTKVINLVNGTVAEFQNPLPVKLASESVEFLLLTSGHDAELPEATLQKTVTATVSISPGMRFVDLQPDQAGQESQVIREKKPGVIYVGIFKSEIERKNPCLVGGEAIFEEVSKLDGVKVEYVADILSNDLEFYDVVIIPNVGSGRKVPLNLREGWEERLRKYVENGGGLLLVHHAIGFLALSKADLLFPEIGKGIDWIENRVMKITAQHPVTTGESLRNKFPRKAKDPVFAEHFLRSKFDQEEEYQIGFVDYVKISQGKQGTVLARSSINSNGKGDDPVLVVGKVGKGKVVLCGTPIGVEMQKQNGKPVFVEKVTPGELKLLINSVYWLAEKK